MAVRIYPAITHEVVWKILIEQLSLKEIEIQTREFNVYESLAQNNVYIKAGILFRGRLLLSAAIDFNIKTVREVLGQDQKQFRSSAKSFLYALNYKLALHGISITTRTSRGDMNVLDPRNYRVRFAVDNQGTYYWCVLPTGQLQGAPLQGTGSGGTGGANGRRGGGGGGRPGAKLPVVPMASFASPSSMIAGGAGRLPASSTSAVIDAARDLTEGKRNGTGTSTGTDASAPSPDTQREEQDAYRSILRWLQLAEGTDQLAETCVVVESAPQVDGTLSATFRPVIYDEALRNTLTSSSRTTITRLGHPAMVSVDVSANVVEQGRLAPYVEQNDALALQQARVASDGARAVQRAAEMKMRERDEMRGDANKQNQAAVQGARRVWNHASGRFELAGVEPWETHIQPLPPGRTAIPAPKPELPSEMLSNVTLRMADAVGMLLGIPASLSGNSIHPTRVNENAMYSVGQVIGEWREIFSTVLRRMYALTFLHAMMRRFSSTGRTIRDLEEADEATQFDVTFTATADPLNTEKLLDVGAIGVQTYVDIASAYSGLAAPKFEPERLQSLVDAKDTIVREQALLATLQRRQAEEAIKTTILTRQQQQQQHMAAMSAMATQSTGSSGSSNNSSKSIEGDADDDAASADDSSVSDGEPKTKKLSSKPKLKQKVAPPVKATRGRPATRASTTGTPALSGSGVKQSTATGTAAKPSAYRTAIPAGAYLQGAGPSNKQALTKAKLRARK